MHPWRDTIFEKKKKKKKRERRGIKSERKTEKRRERERLALFVRERGCLFSYLILLQAKYLPTTTNAFYNHCFFLYCTTLVISSVYL